MSAALVEDTIMSYLHSHHLYNIISAICCNFAIHHVRLLFIGTPNREVNFEDKARRFDSHSGRLANTARMVATAGGCENKRTVEAIQNMAFQVSILC